MATKLAYGRQVRIAIMVGLSAAVALLGATSDAVNALKGPRVADTGGTTTFSGVFIGTDSTYGDASAEDDPQRFAEKLNDWPGWADGSQDVFVESGATDITTDDAVTFDNDAPGATEQEIRDAVAAHKAARMPGEEFIFYSSSHGSTVKGGSPNSCPEVIHAGSSGAGDRVDKGTVDEVDGDGDECIKVDDDPAAGNPPPTTNDGYITDDELAELLSGFRKSVTITVIIYACEAGGMANGSADLNSAQDENNDPYDHEHYRVIMAVPEGELCSAGPFQDALEGCLSANAQGSPKADSTPQPNGDGVATSDELFRCVKDDPDAAAESPRMYDPGGKKPAGEIGGNYDVRITILPAAAGPGIYVYCKADIQQSLNDLEARFYCYVDNPAVEVNPEGSPGVLGDGLPNAPPPPPYGDVDSKHTVLAGSVDKANSRAMLWGCFEDLDGQAPLGAMYLEASVDVQTQRGTVDIWLAQDQTDCTTGAAWGAYDTVAGLPTSQLATFELVKLALKPNEYDSDGDGCSDKNELQDLGTGSPEGPDGPGRKGDARDPYNRWDFYDVDGDKIVTLQNDIVPVIGRFQTPTVNPNPNTGLSYAVQYDRGPTIPGNAGSWNRKAADNIITLQDDILGVILQFGHRCL